jgi:Ca-activated chloride channel family protein
VVLTDGQVTNTDAVLALVSKHAAHNRVFALGIGAGASQHLVNGIARAGGGSAEFIHPGERIEPKVVRLLGRLLSPALTDVAVSWGGLDARQAPTRIPPVFSGGRLLVYAFFSEDSRSLLPTRGELSAVTPSGSVRFDVLLDPSHIVDGKIIATLAARARIRELEEGPEWTTARGSRQQDRKATGVSKEIIELSTRYGVISRETSFVAIERRETPVLGDTQLRRVPIALTAGWGGLDTIAIGRLAGRYGSVGAPVSAGALLLGAPGTGRLAGGDGDTDQARFMRQPMADAPANVRLVPPGIGRALGRLRGLGAGSRLSSVDAGSPPRPPASGDHAAMVVLIALQRADGSWDLSADVAVAVSYELASLESLLSGATGNDADIRRAWATALALAWLDDHAGEFAEEWTMAADKARRWLDGVIARPAGGGSWSSAAARLMTTTSPPRR